MLVIFSKLAIRAEDREWIDSSRSAYDPQHDLIAPHFTFVFPFDGVPLEAVLTHVRQVADATPRLPFRLSQAAAVADPFGPRSHVFLLPTAGAEPMTSLHARLYSGVLSPKLHPTVPFAPHVTVAAFERLEDAERMAASLPAFDIRGVLEAIHIAEFDGTRVTELHELGFG